MEKGLKLYEVLLGEGSEGLIPSQADIDEGWFTYSVLEHLTFSEVLEMLEFFRKQTYHPIITIREEKEDE